MTIAEVEAIMGGQPRDESTGSLAAAEGVKDSKELATEQARWFRLERLGEPADFERAIRPDIWASDEVIIRVYYSEGRVLQADSLAVVCDRAPETVLQKIRRWLRL